MQAGELADRAETVADVVVTALANDATREEELQDHLDGLVGLQNELDSVDLGAVAAADSHPMWVRVSSAAGTVGTLHDILDARLKAASASSSNIGVVPPSTATAGGAPPSLPSAAATVGSAVTGGASTTAQPLTPSPVVLGWAPGSGWTVAPVTAAPSIPPVSMTTSTSVPAPAVLPPRPLPGTAATTAPSTAMASGLTGVQTAATHTMFPFPSVAPSLASSAPTTPSWAAAANPYVTNNALLGPDYYAAFPYPWNVQPTAGTSHHGEVLKVAAQALPKFDGTKKNYLAWRGTFLPCVHLTTIPMNLKVMLLRSTMSPDATHMKEFIMSIVFTAEGYRQAICTLERDYGGDEALLLTRQEALLELPLLREGDYTTLKTLYQRLGAFINQWATLNAGVVGGAESITFFRQLFNRIDRRYAHKYINWAQEGARVRNLQSLYLWMGQQCENHRIVAQYTSADVVAAASATSKQKTSFQRRDSPQFPSSHMDRNYKSYPPVQNVYAAAEEKQPTQRRGPCPLCDGTHPLNRCFKFRDFNITDKKRFLMDQKRCFLCFAVGHMAQSCHVEFRCRDCGARHHTSLHVSDNPQQKTVLVAAAEHSSEGEAAAVDNAAQFGLLVEAAAPSAVEVSLRTLPVWLENPLNGRGKLVNALLDDGCSGGALVSGQLAEELALRGKMETQRTEGVGGHITTFQTITAPLRVGNAEGTWKKPITAQVMKKPAGNYRPFDWTEKKRSFPHLQAVPVLPPVSSGRVDVLIGNLYPHLLMSLSEIAGVVEQNEPIARLTPLGWTITGPTTAASGETLQRAHLLASALTEPEPLGEGDGSWTLDVTPTTTHTLMDAALPTDKQLLKLVEKMLRVENGGEHQVLSPKEEYVIKQIRSSLVRIGEQYQSTCTWAPGGGRPDYNYKQALRRLHSLEQSKYFKTLGLRDQYAAVIHRWAADDVVTKISEVEARYLIPHFPILKDSETTPIRPVMDCKIALNQHLLAGPNLLNNIDDVLLRYRSCLYTFSGDIKQMFLRILLHPDDRPYHCFLWRDEEDREVEVFRFNTHVFGNAGSPFVAVFVVQEHAAKYKTRFPEAVDTLFRSTLIDDVLDSADSIQQARDSLMHIKYMLGEAGMTVAKCHSNEAAVLQDLPDSAIAPNLVNISKMCQKEQDLSSLKALGIACDTATDSFYFTIGRLEPPKVWTNRLVLKTFPRLFDPLGLLLPFTIRARAHFSKLISKDRAWDKPLPPSKEWQMWINQLQEVPQVRFPRCVKTSPQTEATLHLFSDASETAYAAAAYLVTRNHLGDVVVRLVAAKAHVAPPKAISIPRLELMAAELSVKLRLKVTQALKINIVQFFHWTDSTTVLYWLRDDKKRFQAFVHNKLVNIRRITTDAEWRYVPSALNPADLPSRGVDVRLLMGTTIWHVGPPFLQQQEQEWPPLPPLLKTSAVLQEMRKVEQIFTLHNHHREPVIDFDRIGTWGKGWRVVHRIYKAWDGARQRLGHPPMGKLWQRAERALIRQAQLPLMELRGADAAMLKREGFVRLKPTEDDEGVWRGQGRLSLVKTLPYDARCPIILPKKTRPTQLLLQHYHVAHALHYGGINHTLAVFSTRFWTPHARQVLRNLLKDCVPCRRRMAAPVRPPQAGLPPFRVAQEVAQGQATSVAFAVTAVDCAGPYRVRRGRSYETHYLLLLTCCQVRAVRLEHLTALSLDAFLMALVRASARGVNPNTLLSDNGANFDAANTMLKQLWSNIDVNELMTRKPGLKWKFNPPYASHYGGVFERLIKAAKEALYPALPAHLTLTLEQLQTAFAQVEAVLNARPLTYQSMDATDPTPITPNHFLFGAASLPLHEDLTLLQPDGCLTKKFRLLNEATRVFCNAFAREIRPALQLNRNISAKIARRDVQPGDVVTFFLPTSSKKWPLAIVERVFPGKDGRVRTVQIKLPRHNSDSATYAPLPPKFFLRDVGDIALLLPGGKEDQPSLL